MLHVEKTKNFNRIKGFVPFARLILMLSILLLNTAGYSDVTDAVYWRFEGSQAGSPITTAADESGKAITVAGGKTRFQILTPTLVRMEYSPTEKFVNDPSVVVINRDQWLKTPFTHRERDGWLEIETEKMTLRYKIESGPFSAENLAVAWRDETGEHTWKLGDKDDRNLGRTGGIGLKLTLPVRSVPGFSVATATRSLMTVTALCGIRKWHGLSRAPRRIPKIYTSLFTNTITATCCEKLRN